LLGGIIAGGWVVVITGLFSKWGPVMSTPLESMTQNDVLTVVGSIAIVFGLGWLGARIGLALAARIEA
jgi:hypothetical protein